VYVSEFRVSKRIRKFATRASCDIIMEHLNGLFTTQYENKSDYLSFYKTSGETIKSQFERVNSNLRFLSNLRV